jgi:3-hydroxybutyryl-CoA dehydratase
MSSFYVSVGDEVVLERHVSEAAVQAFADVSGDHSPNHVDESAMSGSAHQGRIAHGALIVAYMSACSTEIVERIPNVRATETPVSLGYDRVRFLKPVHIGDDLRLRYAVREVDAERRRARAEITVTNQNDETVCVGQHILKWVG